MNKIKSERAKNYLLDNSAHRDSKEGKEMGVVTTYVDATKAVLIAEDEMDDKFRQYRKDINDAYYNAIQKRYGYTATIIANEVLVEMREKWVK